MTLPASLFAKSAELVGNGSRSLLVQGAGHWPHREGEEEFVETLVDFLGDDG